MWRNLFEPSTGLSHLGIFLNGSQVLSETLPLQLEGSVPAYVGRYNGLYLDGMVDHFQIFRQALSDAEIAALKLQAPLINLHFNDPADSLAFVNSAGSPHGVCAPNACPVAGTKGQVGTAVHFDGVDDLVSMSSTLTPTASARACGSARNAARTTRPCSTPTRRAACATTSIPPIRWTCTPRRAAPTASSTRRAR
ncbi:MAG: hypothetical protein M9927_06685 [Anaerolineae bacterium]|nr:hypothetical protein [Anaerolineae bacterium]